MNLILSGRGVNLDDALREYATEKFSRAQRFFDRILKVEAVFIRERNPRIKDHHRVELTVGTPKETLRVHGEGLDHFAAIDVAADRLEAQMRKHKERLVDRSHRVGPIGNGVAADTQVDGSDDGEGRRRIVRMSPSIDKPLTPEEARLELEERNTVFLYFVNAESMRPAVLFRRADDFGLIEHEG